MIQYVLYRESLHKFIGCSDTGKILHVDTLEEAHIFNTPNGARNFRKQATKKTAYYHVYRIMDNGNLQKVSENVSKRKSFSQAERVMIYRKTKGHCYLCGDFVDFDKFEIEHKIPLSKGGTNDLSNLYCSCHICNTIKHDIYPADFMERISKIFMYQMKKKFGNTLWWKIAHRLIQEME